MNPNEINNEAIEENLVAEVVIDHALLQLHFEPIAPIELLLIQPLAPIELLHFEPIAPIELPLIQPLAPIELLHFEPPIIHITFAGPIILPIAGQLGNGSTITLLQNAQYNGVSLLKGTYKLDNGIMKYIPFYTDIPQTCGNFDYNIDRDNNDDDNNDNMPNNVLMGDSADYLTIEA